MALEANRREKMRAELPEKHDVHLNQISDWREQLLARAATVFGAESSAGSPPVDLKALHAKIGPLTLENGFLESLLAKAGMLSARK